MCTTLEKSVLASKMRGPGGHLREPHQWKHVPNSGAGHISIWSG